MQVGGKEILLNVEKTSGPQANYTLSLLPFCSVSEPLHFRDNTFGFKALCLCPNASTGCPHLPGNGQHFAGLSCRSLTPASGAICQPIRPTRLLVNIQGVHSFVCGHLPLGIHPLMECRALSTPAQIGKYCGHQSESPT